MKIKVKFMLGLTIILVIFSLLLNILIRQVLISNMESSIKTSLEEIMRSTREYVKYRLAISSSFSDTDGFKHDASYIAKYVVLNNDCKCVLLDMKGTLIYSEKNSSLEEITSNNIKKAEKGQAVVDLKYGVSEVHGILAFPIYINSNYVGIIALDKSYSASYITYKKTIQFITLGEFLLFLFIFVLTLFMTSKITRPITILTKAVKEVGQGNYEVKMRVKGKDEIGILSQEFINMKDKINEQIQTIKLEKEKVEKLEKGRRDFFNNVTHELKTPLTAISGYAEMMLEGIVEDEEFRKRANERIYLESERLHKLVLELISVAKGSSSLEEEKKPIDMYKLLNEICDDMNIKARKYYMAINRKIEAGYIFGQTDRIRQVIINIIDNAIKYSVKGEFIFVKAYISEGNYNIEVENKSEPIPDEIFKNIFDPFVKKAGGNEEQSRGLGLYICSEIIKEHDGVINLENGEIIKTRVKIPFFSNNLATN
ncbi:HAMP domain-containing histidine kinase [Clostridium sp. 19966]|uniref:HAMP domain-containing sensor histidine kinase n=1 Tax=Clostridium sp. 19966 TaxID=2768166 RepID=UPI0028DD6DE1|nr:HAMP domain-containing sensor histidine kinase [Clostridium sp. 19966]MDT8717130.1 HAMP domain-containing histidine kinase [Clostridium sp. 19966]